MQWFRNSFPSRILLVGLLAAAFWLSSSDRVLLRGQQPNIQLVPASELKLGLIGESDLWDQPATTNSPQRTASSPVHVQDSTDAIPKVADDFRFAEPPVSGARLEHSPVGIGGSDRTDLLADPTQSLEPVRGVPKPRPAILTQPWWSRAFEIALERPELNPESTPEGLLRGTPNAFSRDGSEPRNGGEPSNFYANQRPSIVGRPWHLDQLIWLAVEHSPLVQSVLVEPQIQQARAVAATGVFDPTTFVESIFNDTSDPVGNTLVTGSANRLNEHLWENRSGIRNKNRLGGQADFSQEFLFKDNNSDFFIPANQADTKMVLSYTQPLLRGRGEEYNQASIVVALLKSNQSAGEAAQKIQDHAYKITTTYWELFTARAQLEQIDRGLQSLRRLRDQLQGRADIDGLRSQLLRADAAISRQNANRAHAVAECVTAESRLRAAVAAPELLENRSRPLLPATPSMDWRSRVEMQDELGSALTHRPEIQVLKTGLKAARVRLQVAEHELRPTLNLVLEGYLRGLNGEFDAAKSFGDQFSEGAPSYTAGLAYSRPYRNQTARAILRERRLELRRTLLELDNALLTIGAEVESAVARLDAAFQQLEAAVQSTLTTLQEIEYLEARLQNAFLDSSGTSIVLDQLLDAELKLIQSENAWAKAQGDHMIALANLRLATGSLLPNLASQVW